MNAEDQDPKSVSTEENSTSTSEEALLANSVGTDAERITAFADFIQKNPDVLGGGDIYNITGGKPVARAGQLAAMLAGIGLEDGERALRRYMIIIPASDDAEAAAELAWNQFTNAFKQLAGRALEQSENDWFRSRFKVGSAPDSRISSLLTLIGEQPERTAVIVTKAATYRDDTVEPFVADGARTLLAPEDIWAPQLHALAKAAMTIADRKTLYVALDADEISPVQPDLQNLILSVDRCGAMGATSRSNLETIVTPRAAQWDRWIAEGKVGLALRDVDAMPNEVDPHKAFLRVQLLHKAGLHLEALAAIRSELMVRGVDDPYARVRLARIATDAGASGLARELLEPCIDKLESREDLESALGTLRSIGADALEKQAADLLEARYPGAESVRRHKLEQLLRKREFGDAADLLRDDDPERAAFYELLNTSFSGDGVPDYISLIGSIEDAKQSDAFRLASVDDALARGQPGATDRYAAERGSGSEEAVRRPG